MGEGEKPPNPMETIVFMKEILSPIFNRNKAEWKFWYKQENQHQIIRELGLLQEAIVACGCCVMFSRGTAGSEVAAWSCGSQDMTWHAQQTQQRSLKQSYEVLGETDLKIWVRFKILWDWVRQWEQNKHHFLACLLSSLCNAMTIIF
jgi:SAM-dependent MidA family methyltransferase